MEWSLTLAMLAALTRVARASRSMCTSAAVATDAAAGADVAVRPRSYERVLTPIVKVRMLS